jgi:hypothetical protein
VTAQLLNRLHLRITGVGVEIVRRRPVDSFATGQAQPAAAEPALDDVGGRAPDVSPTS